MAECIECHREVDVCSDCGSDLCNDCGEECEECGTCSCSDCFEADHDHEEEYDTDGADDIIPPEVES